MEMTEPITAAIQEIRRSIEKLRRDGAPPEVLLEIGRIEKAVDEMDQVCAAYMK